MKHFVRFSLTLMSLALSSYCINAVAQDVQVNFYGPLSSLPGSSGTYKIYVTNNGTSTATGVKVTMPPSTNFSAASITSSTGLGTGAGPSTPTPTTVAGLQSTGINIATLPSHSVVELDVTGTFGNTVGSSVTQTVTITSTSADPNSSNNSATITTQIFTPLCQSTYSLDGGQTASTNTLSPTGGTLNLVYTLSSGPAITGIGNSFTVPVIYSGLNNNVNTVSNLWERLYQGTTLVPVATASAGGIYNSLPVQNQTTLTSSLPQITATTGNLDQTFVTYIGNGTILPLGTMSINIGTFRSNNTLPPGVQIINETFNTWGYFGSASTNPNIYTGGYWIKPLAQIGMGNTIYTNNFYEQMGQTYILRYSAFSNGSGYPGNSIFRGLVFASSSTISFSFSPPTVTSVLPLTQTVLTTAPTTTPINVLASSPYTTPTYQWYSNTSNNNTGGALISGATNSSYTAPVGTVSGTAYYYVQAIGATGTGNAGCYTASPVATVTTQAPIVTPVVYGKELTASLNTDNTVGLQWTTTTETNNKGFSIERSANTKDFVNIGFVDSKEGNGTGSGKDYGYTDKTPLSGGNYYRLAQTDLDGHVEYSQIVYVQSAGSGNDALKIYPNPVHGTATLSGLEIGSSVVLVAMDGRVLKSWTAVSGTQQLDVTGVPTGIYILKTTIGKVPKQLKFMIQ